MPWSRQLWWNRSRTRTNDEGRLERWVLSRLALYTLTFFGGWGILDTLNNPPKSLYRLPHVPELVLYSHFRLANAHLFFLWWKPTNNLFNLILSSKSWAASAKQLLICCIIVSGDAVKAALCVHGWFTSSSHIATCFSDTYLTNF